MKSLIAVDQDGLVKILKEAACRILEGNPKCMKKVLPTDKKSNATINFLKHMTIIITSLEKPDSIVAHSPQEAYIISSTLEDYHARNKPQAHA